MSPSELWEIADLVRQEAEISARPGQLGRLEALADRLVDASERLEALEEIRQYIADGWEKYRSPHVLPSYYWLPRGNLYHRELMSDEVAALLWPAPSTGDTEPNRNLTP